MYWITRVNCETWSKLAPFPVKAKLKMVDFLGLQSVMIHDCVDGVFMSSCGGIKCVTCFVTCDMLSSFKEVFLIHVFFVFLVNALS